MIPSLYLPTAPAKGVGKLNGSKPRLTVGTESGDLLDDVQFVHVIAPDHYAVLDEVFPGASTVIARAAEPQSSGRYKLQWWPSQPAARATIRRDGTVLYGGPALVQRADLRVLPNAVVMTLYVRLESTLPDDHPELLRALNQLVEYELAFMPADSETRLADPRQGQLFTPDAVECEAGDLVTLADGTTAIVVSTAGAQGPIIRRALVDGPDVTPEAVPASDVRQAIRICGPRGGPPDDALRRLSRASPLAGPAELMIALMSAQQAGQTELIDDAGWALTSTVISTAARLADGNAVVEPATDEVQATTADTAQDAQAPSDDADADLPDPV